MITEKIKQAIVNTIKTHVDFQEKRIASIDIAKMRPLADRMISEYGAEKIHSPLDFMTLFYSLLGRNQAYFKKIKWLNCDDLPARRFQRFLEELSFGDSSIDYKDSLEILSFYNDYMGNVEPIELWGADISWHFRLSSSFAQKGRLLYDVVRFLRPESALEIGTAYGMSGLFILLAMEKYVETGSLYTIERGEPQYSLSSKVLRDRFRDRVVCRKGSSEEWIPKASQETPKFDMVFHDGGHTKDNYIRDFRNMSGHLSNGAIVIFDDIKWFDQRICREDPKCYEGWQAIIADPQVRIAVEVNETMGIALT